MIRLIKNAEVFTPEPIGKKDVLFAGSQICQISDKIDIEGDIEVDIIDGQGKYLFPGFIDNHVHITGGGGEGGFGT
ncbi:Isoaspartyl dipeptidase [bioreactor metagenome]|uniref:Isoaspartyl dipeptidase n=1 Tax=bioreactor metagenome TaxID=1076179 RepID=A0A645HCD3_9ZZZZ